MWAKVADGGPTLTQLWFKASYPYSQHEVLTRAEWILPSTSDAGPTFKSHWVGVGLYSPPEVSTTRPACWFDAGPALQTLGSKHWVNVSCLLGVMGVVPKRNNKLRLIRSLYYCPQKPFNNINYKSHRHYIYQPSAFMVMLLEGRQKTSPF